VDGDRKEHGMTRRTDVTVECMCGVTDRFHDITLARAAGWHRRFAAKAEVGWLCPVCIEEILEEVAKR
jgi:phosphoserine phosphatase